MKDRQGAEPHEFDAGAMRLDEIAREVMDLRDRAVAEGAAGDVVGTLSLWPATMIGAAARLTSRGTRPQQARYAYSESLGYCENAELRAEYVEYLCRIGDFAAACVECNKLGMELLGLASTAREVLTLICNTPALGLGVSEGTLRACVLACGRDRTAGVEVVGRGECGMPSYLAG